MPLTNKVVVVAQATREPGRRIALAFAERGARVVGLGDDQRALAELAPHIDLALSQDTPLSGILAARYGQVDIAVDLDLDGALQLSSQEPLARLLDRSVGRRVGLLRRALRRLRRG